MSGGSCNTPYGSQVEQRSLTHRTNISGNQRQARPLLSHREWNTISYKPHLLETKRPINLLNLPSRLCSWKTHTTMRPCLDFNKNDTIYPPHQRARSTICIIRNSIQLHFLPPLQPLIQLPYPLRSHSAPHLDTHISYFFSFLCLFRAYRIPCSPHHQCSTRSTVSLLLQCILRVRVLAQLRHAVLSRLFPSVCASYPS